MGISRSSSKNLCNWQRSDLPFSTSYLIRSGFGWNLRTIHKRGFPGSNRQKKDATDGFLAVRRLSGDISTSQKSSAPECSITVTPARVSKALMHSSTARRFLFGSKHTEENVIRSATRMRSARGRECLAWARSNGAGIFRESAPSGSALG